MSVKDGSVKTNDIIVKINEINKIAEGKNPEVPEEVKDPIVPLLDVADLQSVEGEEEPPVEAPQEDFP